MEDVNAAERPRPLALPSACLTAAVLLLGSLVGVTHPKSFFAYDAPPPCGAGWLCRSPLAALPGAMDLACAGIGLLGVALTAGVLLRRVSRRQVGPMGRAPQWWLWLWPALFGAAVAPAAASVFFLALLWSVCLAVLLLAATWLVLCAPVWWVVRLGGRPRTLALRTWLVLPLGLVAAGMVQLAVHWGFGGLPDLWQAANPVAGALGGLTMALVARALLGGAEFSRQGDADHPGAAPAP